MVLGGLVAALRSYPAKVFEWIKRQVIIEAEVLNHDAAYEWVKLWLHKHPYSKRSRRLTVSCIPGLADEDLPRIVFSPAPGDHFFTYKGRLLWIKRERTDATGKDSLDAMMRPKETIRFRMLGRSQAIIRALIEDTRAAAEAERKSRFSIHMSSGYGYWSKMPINLQRSLDSVVLPKGVVEGVVEDIREFNEAKDWYGSLGIPYHRGYLFHGTAGSGKSSLVVALAAEMKMDLYVLQLSGSTMNDSTLSDLIRSMEVGSILLLEDIDAVVPHRRDTPDDSNKEKGGVTMSGLLNCLDGVLARDGSLVFMTTNYKEKLDPALIRPGRIDYQIEFGSAEYEQAHRMFTRFFPDATEQQTSTFAGAFAGKTMCEIQQHLIKNKQSADTAVAALANSGESA